MSNSLPSEGDLKSLIGFHFGVPGSGPLLGHSDPKDTSPLKYEIGSASVGVFRKMRFALQDDDSS